MNIQSFARGLITFTLMNIQIFMFLTRCTMLIIFTMSIARNVLRLDERTWFTNYFGFNYSMVCSNLALLVQCQIPLFESLSDMDMFSSLRCYYLYLSKSNFLVLLLSRLLSLGPCY